jgi:thiamine-phosphate pyrophosphorylase
MRVAFPPLYAIVDAALLGSAELSFIETIAESGVVLLQYRNKRATSRQLFDACSSFSARLQPFVLLSPEGLRFLVNDRPDIALLARAGGVHVGQDDLGVEEARAIVGRERWVGVSTHTLPQVEAADKTSADYVAFGPVFPTVTKANPDPVVGLELLSQVRALTRKPLVAIGGITLDRAAETYRAGADSLAVARDLIAAADPSARVRAFLDVATAVTPTARP